MDAYGRLCRERDSLRAQLDQARRLLEAVGKSDRSSRGRLELTRELELAVLAFAMQPRCGTSEKACPQFGS